MHERLVRHLVADGVHTKQPKELMQLYCVHDVCNGGVEVPLLYSMTARKTEDVYTRIFGHLKNLFERNFMQGHGRVLVVAEWWDTIKGMVFLPKRLYPEGRVLWRPPVPEDHVAYENTRSSWNTCTRRGSMVRTRICGTSGNW
ncbi:unnamed protein product [Haemonchus placei]|uniref:Uncharacterized protein n=1 Tax=Haemonchus placei TaxID=6290 RepID=A0A3P7WNH9_HAEPC|nr:unnamed protein product [Haemonchus placei]